MGFIFFSLFPSFHLCALAGASLWPPLFRCECALKRFCFLLPLSLARSRRYHSRRDANEMRCNNGTATNAIPVYGRSTFPQYYICTQNLM